jgi:transcriptional regulator GlxA family with amidase domain
MSIRAPHQVAVLVLPGVLPLDFGIPVQAFGGDPRYHLTVCAEAAGEPVACGGFTVTAPAGLGALGEADTVVVPGYQEAPSVPPTEPVLAAIRGAHARGARLVSICSGAFALAAAGILDGRPATTHWQESAHLQRAYPRVRVQPDRLYIDDGDILTSAGVTAGVDLCLHIIRADHGAAAANERARALVAPPRRPGGQAQFVARLRPADTGVTLAPVREWMLGNLEQRHTLDELAQRAHMSRRTFIRRFHTETGLSPMAWLTSARLDWARELLETTTVPVERIAGLSGLGRPAALRATFHRHVGTSPNDYRATFRHSAETGAE